MGLPWGLFWEAAMLCLSEPSTPTHSPTAFLRTTLGWAAWRQRQSHLKTPLPAHLAVLMVASLAPRAALEASMAAMAECPAGLRRVLVSRSVTFKRQHSWLRRLPRRLQRQPARLAPSRSIHLPLAPWPSSRLPLAPWLSSRLPLARWLNSRLPLEPWQNSRRPLALSSSSPRLLGHWPSSSLQLPPRPLSRLPYSSPASVIRRRQC
mmetsp:Transcript_119618/g.338604  ORF Transcript_119618/g.338604 Transcript_119618/m.338604 type:complete len:207 (-) Transcript_119618:1193-1813(-)